MTWQMTNGAWRQANRRSKSRAAVDRVERFCCASETRFATQQIDVGEGAFAEEFVFAGYVCGTVLQRPVAAGPIHFFGDDFQKQFDSFGFQ